MRKLYSAYDEEENFKALVMAEDKTLAKGLMNEYSKDANLSSEWRLKLTSIEDIKSEVFDCDYLIQNSNSESDGVVYLENVKEFVFSKKWEPKIFVATEADGFNFTNLVMVIEVADGVNFEQAAILASTEYCLTEKGKQTYEENCCCFNWGDFDTYVPNTICEKYGFRKTQSSISKEFCFDQQLVDKQDIFPEE